MSKVLYVLMYGQPMGRLIAKGGTVSFHYEDSWLERPDNFPLSLSMPLSAKDHPNRVVNPYLWNLLPDNEETLRTWARNFGVKKNAFALLSFTGEDLPGAAQIVKPERLEVLTAQQEPVVQWLDEAQIAQRLRELRTDRTAWLQPGDVGYFSLAGAQPKMALHRQGDRWGIPAGRTPTTHILKPPIPDLEGFAENEHFCLRLASRVGLPVANSAVMRFEDEVAFVTERFDRVLINGEFVRVHTEDFCQALAVRPERKYQNMGGPGPREILRLLASESSRREEDCATFFDALAFNYLIGGTDAHAKNYSLLHGPRRVRLAPLYDIASALPYYDVKQLKLAMKIGSHYELRYITDRDWDALGEIAGLTAAGSARVRELAGKVLEQLPLLVAELRDQGLSREILTNLETSIRKFVTSKAA
nr:MAG: type II toxin-antitoxin system HipA family toxin [Pseudomonadota bacterium]